MNERLVFENKTALKINIKKQQVRLAGVLGFYAA